MLGIPTWPGRPDLLPAYSDGWDAYNDFYMRTEGGTAFGDPADHVPADLTEAEHASWCMGWLEAMIASNAINSARASGVGDDAALWRVAVAEVNAIRDTYLHGYQPERPN